jgi:hypothetical protein
VIVCENKENGFENQLEKSSSWTLLLWQEKSSLKLFFGGRNLSNVHESLLLGVSFLYLKEAERIYLNSELNESLV